MKSTEEKGIAWAVKDMAVRIPAGDVVLNADLTVQPDAKAIIVFAHGSGSGRHSPRNRHVAEILNEHGFATLLADLLTEDEEAIDEQTREIRFDIPKLAKRLVSIAQWLEDDPDLRGLKIGWFGASTGAGAALIAAARHPENVIAVVSRGGRPDLAGDTLPEVKAPVLLIVGGNDHQVIELNRQALSQLESEAKLEIVPGATHLFEEQGALDEVARLAAEWFHHHSSAQ
jgi:dienelactone hydrolase